jgi:2-methylcitrate dehydratase PrpD
VTASQNAGKPAKNANQRAEGGSFALDLARCINSVTYDTLPSEAVYWARALLLDTVGATLAGVNEEAPRIIREQTRRSAAAGPAVVIGCDYSLNALDAALVNGVASHVLDFDDCSNTMSGHPSASILPALFSVAQEYGASGKDFIAAYVAGIETNCKFARGVNFYMYNKGWHPTSTIGILGCTAACSRLLKLSDDQTAMALGIAASFASGVKSNFGTMTKSLHVGHSNRSALLAVLLARDGYTSSSEAFEHHHGYFNAFNGEGNYDASLILPEWANPFDITRPGITMKLYPCCGATHPAIEAMMDVVTKNDLKPDDIAHVEVLLQTRRLAHTNRPRPNSDLDAKFSVQYVVARAATDRRITLDQFENGAYLDPAVQRLLPKIHAGTYTAEHFPLEHHFGSVVTVTTTSGKVLTGKIFFQLGRTVDIPAPPELMKQKFEDCAQRTLPREQVAKIYETIQRVEKLSDMGELTRLLALDATDARRAAAA